MARTELMVSLIIKKTKALFLEVQLFSAHFMFYVVTVLIVLMLCRFAVRPFPITNKDVMLHVLGASQWIITLAVGSLTTLFCSELAARYSVTPVVIPQIIRIGLILLALIPLAMTSTVIAGVLGYLN